MTSKMIRLNVVVLVLGLMIHGGANQAAAQLENSAWQSHYGQPQGPAYQAQIQFQGPQGSYDVQGSKGQFSNVTYYRDQNTGAVNAITGNWTFADGNKGWYQFKLSPDGQSFTGTFGYGAFGSPTSGYWNGKRIGEPVPPPNNE